jgi:hypothetical protein
VEAMMDSGLITQGEIILRLEKMLETPYYSNEDHETLRYVLSKMKYDGATLGYARTRLPMEILEKDPKMFVHIIENTAASSLRQLTTKPNIYDLFRFKFVKFPLEGFVEIEAQGILLPNPTPEKDRIYPKEFEP